MSLCHIACWFKSPSPQTTLTMKKKEGSKLSQILWTEILRQSKAHVYRLKGANNLIQN